jgi:hypothetical protein
MVQSKGNGHDPDINPVEVNVFEPAFVPGEEEQEPLGWFETDLKGDEGEVISDLPPELQGDEPEQPPN